MDYFGDYLPQWLISNSVALLILAVAFWKTKWARLLFMIMFAAACYVNLSMAFTNPEDYLNYAALTPFEPYQQFIQGWFSRHITVVVASIAIGQGLIAIGMVLYDWYVKIACIGAIVFLLAIIPLGIGSAFPFSIIASIALYRIYQKDELKYLWKK